MEIEYQNQFPHKRDDVGTSVPNLKGKCCTVTKVYRFVKCRIFIVIKFKTQKGDFAGHCPKYIWDSFHENGPSFISIK